MNYFENKKLLVPFDFSDLAAQAVETAIQIAGNCENVTVLHVVDPTPVYGYSNADYEFVGNIEMGEPNASEAATIDQGQEQRALTMMRGQFGDTGHVGLQFATAVDDASHGIADFAANHEIDVIVMPSHGRSGLKRLLIGSVAERVVRLAHCPVMILRS